MLNPKKKARVPKGKRELQEVLNLKNNDDWMRWLQSRLVKGFWEEHWNCCLKHAKVNSGETKRGPGLATMLRRIKSGESKERVKYSRRYRKKNGWDKADHIACFLLAVKNQNEIDRNGVLFEK